MALAIWALLLSLAALPMFAYQLWDPLDTSPYLICFGCGCAFSFALYHAWQLPRFRDHRSCAGVFLVILSPFLFMGVGIGANSLLDRSPATKHATTFVSYVSRQKGGIRAHFVSWREPGTVEEYRCTPLRDIPCPDMPRGQPVTVSTHHGALGWEWISDIAARDPAFGAPEPTGASR